VDGCRDLGQVMILSLEMDLLQDLDGSASSQITHADLPLGEATPGRRESQPLLQICRVLNDIHVAVKLIQELGV